jgi:polyphosphate kinase 2 (PPK2 family)
VRERGYWDDYQVAYEQAIRATATPHAPWYVVPADNKWYLRLVVVAAVVQALEEMDLAYPRVGEDKEHELVAARALLDQER